MKTYKTLEKRFKNTTCDYMTDLITTYHLDKEITINQELCDKINKATGFVCTLDYEEGSCRNQITGEYSVTRYYYISIGRERRVNTHTYDFYYDKNYIMKLKNDYIVLHNPSGLKEINMILEQIV